MSSKNSDRKQHDVDRQGVLRKKGTTSSETSGDMFNDRKQQPDVGTRQVGLYEKGTGGFAAERTPQPDKESRYGTSVEKRTGSSDKFDKVNERKQQPDVGSRQGASREKGTISADKFEKINERKQKPDVGQRQDASREKGTNKTEMPVYTNTREESLKNKVDKMPNIYKSSDEYFEYRCDPCKTAGDQVEAQGFCSNCEEYLCDTCFRSHSRSKVSSHHTLLDKDAMPKRNRKVCDPCKTAGDDMVAVGFCEDCNEHLCDSCYKSHSRSKLSKDHVLVDNVSKSEESKLSVTSSIAKMNIQKADVSELKSNEEYTFIRDINVKAASEDKDCFITGMALVSNTEMVVCDSNNYSLKLVDIEKRKLKDLLLLQAEPGGITAISKDQIAVVLQNKYQIQIVSISGRLSVARTLKTDGNCLDVKYINGKLYVSYSKPVKFQILQPTGVVSKTIKPDSEVLKHCSVPCHIAVRPDEKFIYVSDWETNKLLSMDMNGNMKSKYQGELAYPHDVAIYSLSSVYLCNRDQHVMYKMTSDLKEAAVILVPGDGLVFPHAMCFNTDKQHLYISSGSLDAKDKNFIKIFKWK